jgi:vacuolar-type H+-ATPase subunit H
MEKTTSTPDLEELAQDSEKLLESALESNIKLTYEARIEAHENARQLLADLRQAGEELRAKPQRSS